MLLPVSPMMLPMDYFSQFHAAADESASSVTDASTAADSVSLSLTDERPSKKRKKSPKQLDLNTAERKFHCSHDGCDKSYSRAEHLYRHQLNRMYIMPGGTRESRITESANTLFFTYI